jgi:hypothetical protein
MLGTLLEFYTWQNELVIQVLEGLSLSNLLEAGVVNTCGIRILDSKLDLK